MRVTVQYSTAQLPVERQYRNPLGARAFMTFQSCDAWLPVCRSKSHSGKEATGQLINWPLAADKEGRSKGEENKTWQALAARWQETNTARLPLRVHNQQWANNATGETKHVQPRVWDTAELITAH